MKEIKLYSYKGKGKTTDKLIKWWTRGPYSHTELQIGDYLFSASQYDGSVRYIPMHRITEKNWDIVDLGSWDLDYDRIEHFSKTQIGKKYDWKGIFLSQIFPFNTHSKNRWFCSEICHYALMVGGMKDTVPSYNVHPNKLHDIVTLIDK